ncbi:DUF1801 domain-containing protein [Parapedobacter sp. SGR-10]|uniref:DUF1801 domain-containing protein n=1 Tax=Parapedobacter sp. SGR-10 TaxID=2710879 RepID=UPI0013D545FA|nr:DUF1801 domain-containing protein [Parapedobacter sp. SGR-10]NGF57927.1 DUF1801 domain-containing protein [Parapedobacter sp. SGR-10]
MVKNKTAYTDENVVTFIEQVEDDQKRQDSYDLIRLMEQVAGEKAKMFGPSIVGFGQYHYRYDSGHEGDAPLIGFSPRKAAISLYVHTGSETQQHLLEKLGKSKVSKGCIYVKRLKDIDQKTLIALMKDTIDFLSSKYTRIQIS